MNNYNVKNSKKDTQIELFATSKGVYAIDSPVRVKILSMLRKNELSFDQIVALSGKAKSTISVHLKKLVDEGIIDSKPDPEDARKKIFFINSEYLGELSHEKRLEDSIESYVTSYVSSDGDPFEFFRLMFKTIRVALMAQGINIDPILYEAGLKVGDALYEKVADPKIDKFLQNIADFWETHYLGTIEVKNMDPLIINVYDCYECKGLPYTGVPACAFDSGILKSLFTTYFQDEQSVKETKCYAMGDDYCCFAINKK
ncbi:V4R domain-containing protein [Methanobacterium oryzae]|uniref:V4R domain-containing protein n=1 Tax=Methanobacterium oryzae TaxID=69540 RepID=UPI003D1EF6C2